jgi:GAF domain-containing protein
VRPREGPIADTAHAGPVERLLAMAQHELRMDAAVLSHVCDGHEVVLSAVSNGRIRGVTRGVSVPLDETICQRLLQGAVDGVVCDATIDEKLRDLPLVRETGLRAYIGVPLDVNAVRDYVLCCVALDARPDLGEADVRFLRGLAESARPVLDRLAAAH